MTARWLRRRTNVRQPRKVFLIVCEGERTEPDYFRGFRVAKEICEVVGTGMNTYRLVQEAERRAKEGEYEEVWCVFDHDSFSRTDVRRAFDRAAALGFKVAFSNEAFELWYLLHYMYLDTAISRKAYNDKLSEQLGRRYKKADPEMYYLLLERQPYAMKMARKLAARTEGAIWEKKPCTTVHLLVEALNRNLIR